jgi:hypothetical protein
MLSLSLILFFFSVLSMLRVKRRLSSALSDLSVSIDEFRSMAPAVRQNFLNQFLPVDGFAIYIARDWLRIPHEEPRLRGRISLDQSPLKPVSRWSLLKEIWPGYAWAKVFLLPLCGSAIYVLVGWMLNDKPWSVDGVFSAFASSVTLVMGIVIWVVSTTLIDHLRRLVTFCEASGISSQEFSGKTEPERRLLVRATFPGARWKQAV